MSNRTKILQAAALAALLAGGSSVRAEVGQTAEPKAVDLKTPVYLQSASAPARKPLMDLLSKVGVAEGLESAGVNVGGLIEGSWGYNFDTPGSHANGFRSFDVDDQDPTINQIDVFAEKTVEAKGDNFDIGGRIEVIWGGDSRFIHSLGLFDHYGAYNVPAADDADSPDEQFDVNQAYIDLALPVGTGLKVRAGKFITPFGYEVINPSGNLFYSHGFLFNYAIPLTNTGVMGTYNFSPELSLTAGISRGWDTSLEDDNDTIDYMAQVSYALSDKTKLIVGAISGADQVGDNGNWRTVVDVILSTTVGDNLTVAVNADYGYEVNSVTSTSGSDAQWYGVAGYASMVLCKQANLNFRAEYFSDKDGARGSAAFAGTQFVSGTLGVAIRPFAGDSLLENLVIRPEVRWDYADDNVFDDGGDNNQFTAAVDAYFTF